MSPPPGIRIPYGDAKRLLSASLAAVSGPVHAALLWLAGAVEAGFAGRRFVDTRLPITFSLRGRTQEEEEREEERKRKRVRKRLLKSLRKKLKAGEAAAGGKGKDAAADPGVATGTRAILARVSKDKSQPRRGSQHSMASGGADRDAAVAAYEARGLTVDAVPERRRGSVLELIAAAQPPEGTQAGVDEVRLTLIV